MASPPVTTPFSRVSRLLPVLAFASLLGCKGGGGVGGAGGNTGTAGTTGTGGAGNAPGEDGAVAFSRAELLGAFGTCAANQARDFRAKAVALDAAVSAYAATPEAATRDVARQVFKDALDTWAVMDPIQFGPTASVAEPGGKGFRDEIYIYPSVSRCFIEENIVSRAYEAADFPMSLQNRRGLWALEYLLFYEGTDTACSGLTGWAALSPDDRDARKRAYAAAVARDVLARAVALDQAWDPAGMNFVQTMRTAGGSGNTVYTTQQAAFERVGLAIFFFDRTVKDDKLGRPLGLDTDYPQCMVAAPPLVPCFESPYAGRSKASLRANLDGLRRITEGCGAGYAGFGFDDLLENVGATEAGGRLRATVAAAQAALDAIEEGDLPEVLVADRASLQALRDAVGSFSTFLKTEMYTLLGFEASVIPTDTDS
jgi:uncharacterized protein